MSIVVTRQLVCDFPDCGRVKKDLIWWESDSLEEGPWRHTSDDRDWCSKHTREQIDALYESGVITVPCGCMTCDPPDNSMFQRMYTCPKCGSKRCPGALDHRYVEDGCPKLGEIV